MGPRDGRPALIPDIAYLTPGAALGVPVLAEIATASPLGDTARRPGRVPRLGVVADESGMIPRS